MKRTFWSIAALWFFISSVSFGQDGYLDLNIRNNNTQNTAEDDSVDFWYTPGGIIIGGLLSFGLGYGVDYLFSKNTDQALKVGAVTGVLGIFGGIIGKSEPHQKTPSKSNTSKSSLEVTKRRSPFGIEELIEKLQTELADSTSLDENKKNCIKIALEELPDLSHWAKLNIVPGLRPQTMRSSSGIAATVWADRLGRIYYTTEEESDILGLKTTIKVADETGEVKFAIVKDQYGASIFVIPYFTGNIAISCGIADCACFIQ